MSVPVLWPVVHPTSVDATAVLVVVVVFTVAVGAVVAFYVGKRQ